MMTLSEWDDRNKLRMYALYHPFRPRSRKMEAVLPFVIAITIDRDC